MTIFKLIHKALERYNILQDLNLQHNLIITMLYVSSSSISPSLRVINFRATVTLVQNGLNADSWEIKHAGQHPKHKCELPT